MMCQVFAALRTFALYSMNKFIFALVLTLGIFSPCAQMVSPFPVDSIRNTHLIIVHNDRNGELRTTISEPRNRRNIF